MVVLDDSELNIPAFSEVCNYCAHLINHGADRECKAFKKIPLPIWEGKHKHRKPYKGDNGIRFEPIKE